MYYTNCNIYMYIKYIYLESFSSTHGKKLNFKKINIPRKKNKVKLKRNNCYNVIK